MILVVEAMGRRALAFFEKRYSPVFASIMKAAVAVMVGGCGSVDGNWAVTTRLGMSAEIVGVLTMSGGPAAAGAAGARRAAHTIIAARHAATAERLSIISLLPRTW